MSYGTALPCAPELDDAKRHHKTTLHRRQKVNKGKETEAEVLHKC